MSAYHIASYYQIDRSQLVNSQLYHGDSQMKNYFHLLNLKKRIYPSDISSLYYILKWGNYYIIVSNIICPARIRKNIDNG